MESTEVIKCPLHTHTRTHTHTHTRAVYVLVPYAIVEWLQLAESHSGDVCGSGCEIWPHSSITRERCECGHSVQQGSGAFNMTYVCQVCVCVCVCVRPCMYKLIPCVYGMDESESVSVKPVICAFFEITAVLSPWLAP